MKVRLATPQDAPVVIECNAAMALETERKELLPDVIGPGVHSLLSNPASGFYVVAQKSDHVIGSLMITKEWSDWRNGAARVPASGRLQAALPPRPRAGGQRSGRLRLPAVRRARKRARAGDLSGARDERDSLPWCSKS